ncbi:MAG TPA: efflux RND transporter periplasmic adaptor subunit [Gammaproteobacteria bacterium]|nr:efflux RND transporter periplasmic adaptor subunit [Gammaproteobacteria bacterium]
MQPGNFLRRVALLALLGLGLGLQACERTAAPPQPSGPIPVTVVTLQAQPVTLTRELNGRTSPFLVAEIRPQVNGIIERRLFEEGGLVQAGQPLYQIDDAVYRANLASAQASLAQAEATRESARATAARMSKLIKSNAVSRQDYDDAVAALGTAEAQVKVAQAAVRNSQIQLGYARITSPISGRAGRSTVTQGALVTANQASALTTVQQLDPINVDLTMSASELLQLRQELAAGTVSKVDEVPVTILLENRTRYPHQGKLTFADLTVEPTTGSFLLQVVVPNPETLLLPGMYVRAVVALARRPQAVLAPQQGITRDPKGNATALVVTADNRVELRQVKVNRTIGDQWLIDSGLAAGDRVIVEGLQKVRPGATVQPTEAAPAAKPGAGQGPPAAGSGR